jgi:alcohol dehydrogenase class IV
MTDVVVTRAGPAAPRSGRGPDTELVFTADAAAEMRRLVRQYAARRILLVASDGAVARTGLPAALGTAEVDRFAGFTANPRLDDVLAGCRRRDRTVPDLIVGVGGGSTMDTAKLVRLLPSDRDRALDVLRGRDDAGPPREIPLVVVSTTAGTGSEVTQFATVYCDGVKLSLDRPAARPDVAVVDPALTASCPATLAASCALDALAHALESLWSVRSTAESRFLALQAGAGLARLLGGGLRTLDDPSREALCRLALQAGLAINRTRTTVGHAFAYPLTVRFGIPHGLACALSLSWLLPLAVEHRRAWCRDPRGAEFVGRRLAEMAVMLGAGSAERIGAALGALIDGTGFRSRLGDYGVTPGDLGPIMADALGSQRTGNSPVALDPGVAAAALRAAL